MQTENSSQVKLADGIWTGNSRSAEDAAFISANDISAIINLSGISDRPIDDVDFFEYMLPNQELMDTEIPKTVTKLRMICTDLQALRAGRRNVLIHCLDGKNKCMLAAGYFLINYCGRGAEDVIRQLEFAYFTPDQMLEEQDEMNKIIPDCEAIAVDIKDQEKKAVRQSIRCLTRASFRKILRGKIKK